MPPPSPSHARSIPHRLYNILGLLSTIYSAIPKVLKRILGELILFFALLLLDAAIFLLRLAGNLLLPLDAVNIVQSATPCNQASVEEEEGKEDDPPIDYTSPAVARGARTDEKETEENEKEGETIVEKGKDSIKKASPEPRFESATVTTAVESDASPSPSRPLMVGLHPAILDTEVVALSFNQKGERVVAAGRDAIGGQTQS